MTKESILEQIQNLGCSLVQVTGGEPLDQLKVPDLLTVLADQGFKVLLETGGHRSIESVDPRIHLNMDLKCPGSKMSKKNLLSNLEWLKITDDLKFVIQDHQDFDWAEKMIEEHSLANRANLWFSPVYGILKEEELANWILESPHTIRMQVQLHKSIWGPETTGV